MYKRQLTVKATDTAGNESAASAGLTLAIDTTAPGQPTIDTPADTNFEINNPTITGRAEAGSTVELLIGTAVVGTETAGSDGAFSIISSPLFDNDYELTVTATDAAGNISSVSTGLDITIDTGANDAPLLTTTTSSVNISTPEIKGTARPGETVTLYINGSATDTTAVADATSGIFSITVPTQTDATYAISVAAPDQNGDPVISDAIDITIDTTAPAAPVITTDTELTKDNTPVIEGTAEAESTVELFNGAISLGTATAGSDGSFSITSSQLPDNDYTLTVLSLIHI